MNVVVSNALKYSVNRERPFITYPEWYLILPSFAYAGTAAYSRMHPGVQYPSDVADGAIIGAGNAFLSHKVNKLLLLKRKIRPCDCPDM